MKKKSAIINAALFVSASTTICLGYFPLITTVLYTLLQIALFYKLDKQSFLTCAPLSFYALLFTLLQVFLGIPLSTALIFWMLGLTLNSSLSLLNNHLDLTFLLGGTLGLIFTLPKILPIAFFAWSISLTLLVLLNRKLLILFEKYTNPEEIKKLLTVFFDKQCSFCSGTMEEIKKRNQTGEVCYASCSSEEDIKQHTEVINYKKAMETIHAIDENNKVLTGTETISALFARTDLPGIAILLQAPGFTYLFKLGYSVLTRLRRTISS